jgi:hypothetical protein
MGAGFTAVTFPVEEDDLFCFAAFSFAFDFAWEIAILLAALEANTSALSKFFPTASFD